MSSKKRIQLLTETEINDLYDKPVFNAHERQEYFFLTKEEQSYLNKYNNARTRIFFILQLGYFKAKQQFFSFDFKDSTSDVEFLKETMFQTTELKFEKNISRIVRKQQIDDILKLTGYSNWKNDYSSEVTDQISKLLRFFPQTHSALRQLFTYFEHKQIVIPTYRTLQDLFTIAYARENKRLDELMKSVPGKIQKTLANLLVNSGGITKFNDLRNDQKDFKFTAVRAEVNKANELRILSEFTKEFIPKLKLSKNAIRYYSDIASTYAAYRIKRLNKTQQWLHLICFISFRYKQILDNLIISFKYHTKALMDGSKEYVKTALIEHGAKAAANIPQLANFLDWFPEREKGLDDNLLNKKAFEILPADQFPVLAEYFKGKSFDKKASKWEFYSTTSRIQSLYLRPIMMAVDFVYYKSDSILSEYISVLKEHYKVSKSPSKLIIPESVQKRIPKSVISFLKKQKSDSQIDPYLFEVYVYQKMYHEIERGRLCCNESSAYCDIELDLVDDSKVDQIEEICEEMGFARIPGYCDDRLDEALKELDSAWKRTNENIENNVNSGFQIKENKDGVSAWSLLYDKNEKLDVSFFNGLPKVEIADLVMFVGNLINMWQGFSHIKPRYVKRRKPLVMAINACLLSEAFGFGVTKMAEMSDLKLHILRTTREDFIRIDTLTAVNDQISNYIESLSIFKHWNLLDDRLLADADGQKHSTSDNNIQSRYSRKYLGRGKGISIYTLIANFVAVNAKNIGLNEYEGHSLYDMIYGNKTDVYVDVVTGDNHSLNKLNFVALDSIGVDYVPSIKNVKDAADELYSFGETEDFQGLLKPKSSINVDLIKDQKRGILRVLLSLILQENTQSIIIRKLNSHARYSRLRAALYEYNKIFKSIHVLNLIDDMQLRKAIRTARNRTEAYHQLQSQIRNIFKGVFKGKRIIDNRISAHASRLIANCVIAYNSMLLSNIYEKMLEEGVSQNELDRFARISPIAWAHILFTGKYKFKNKKGQIDVSKLINALESVVKEQFYSKKI
ncbi:Tn3 family transposase [Marinicella sp. W31]|uniref:Tn3 family transposase n=1 Tax=Marinicella sp. W31 TaxID=3023713 RepID=UPI00375728D3